MADRKHLRTLGLGISLALFALVAQAAGPVHLQVDRLENPLGLDNPAPLFSWWIQDTAQGARQSAYEVLVATSPELLLAKKADLWDSGKITSDQSMNVRYAGVALKPSQRCYWRVLLWDAQGAAYTPSDAAWWENGLMDQKNWRAEWIGWETPEESAVRHAPSLWIAHPGGEAKSSGEVTQQQVAFRKTIVLQKKVRSAALYATGQDTVAAWVNGQSAIVASPFPPYHQMPWKKYVRADVTKSLRKGANTLAIALTHYYANPSHPAEAQSLPMMAALIVEYSDGTVDSFVSDTAWKAALPVEGWQQQTFDDSAWQQAAVWKQAPGGYDTPPGHPWIPDSVKLLQKQFAISGPVQSARLYATALGTYTMRLNGKLVSEVRMAPGWTDYRQRVNYQTYDVTLLLQQGNALEAQLAPGWYSTPLEWYQQPNNYGDTPPALRAQLRIAYKDGRVEWVTTDSEWKAMRSWISHTELYDGESQSLLLKQSAGNAESSAWKPVQRIEPKLLQIEAQNYASIRVEQILKPKSVHSPQPGVFVYDFGQNFTGVVRLHLRDKSGSVVKLRYAELINDDGTLYTDNLRTAQATDRFTLSGGADVLEPQFTFHGFRYVEVSGLAKAPDADALEGLVMHTAAPFTAHLHTGSAMINQLWSNIQWGQRSNFVGLPTDCPQRDERLGWAADAQVFWRAASYNMDLAAFSHKFAADLRGTQATTPFYGIYAPGTATASNSAGAGWSDAGVVIPYTTWLQYGDTAVIEENWAAMEKYLAAIADSNPDHLWVKNSGIPFGDWLSPEGPTQYSLVATAYWAYDVTLMQRMALATGRTAEVEKYAQQFAEIRAAFQKAFVHEDGFVDGADNGPSIFGQINNPNAKSSGGDTQTGYVLALHIHLLPDALRDAAAKKLAAKIEANHGLLGTGFLGTPWLLEELAKNGQQQLAWKLMLNTGYPSWGYLVEHGATTMWERWNGDQMKGDPSMNSYNHYAYGAVGDWLARSAAGVDATPLDPGFHTIVLKPLLDARLGSVNLDYDSAYGAIHSAWQMEAGKVLWKLTIPANSSGWMPLSVEEAAKIQVRGKPLTEVARPETLGTESGYRIPSGQYEFSIAQ